MKRKIFGIVSALFILPFVISCKVGLGQIVDLVAPEISVSKMVSYDESGNVSDTVSDFGSTVYTKKNVTFSGTASDNVEVSSVYAEIKWLNDSDYTALKDATLSGDSWTLDIDFEKEGACWLKIGALDKNSNYGTKSTTVITLFVDESAPESDDWYIDREVNGIQYKLKSLQDLKSILSEDSNLTNPSNKDVAQNGEFLICASFDDAAGIESGTTTISLYDENGNVVASNIEEDSSSTSDYAPKFRIDGAALNLQSSGKSFYQVRYSSSDIVPDANSVIDAEVSLGWFLWWPESDFPRCSITDLEEGATSLSIRTGDSLNITVFDDDALAGTVKCELTGSTSVTETATITSTTERESNLIVKAPSIPQTMTLTVTAKDSNRKELNDQYTVYVTDEFKPSVIFTSPENNQIPSVSGSDAEISFTGITLDKMDCKFLEVIWVPDSVTADSTAKKTLAENWFNSIDYASKSAVTTSDCELENGTGTYAGLKKWSAKLTYTEQSGDFKKYSFSFSIPLLDDDTGFNKEASKDKYLYARVIRSDDIYTESELKLTGDNLAPEIEAINPTGNMAYVDQDNDLTIQFRGVKSSGLPMNISKYALYEVTSSGESLVDGEYNETDKCYEIADPITSSELETYVNNNKNPKFRYYVEDVLGNSTTGTYEFLIDSLPQIQTVTSSASTQCKKGDVIYINVSFSKPISCTSDVQLKLKNIVNTSQSITADKILYAEYYSGTGSTTLIFKYTVQEGDKSDELQVYNESGSGPIKGITESTAHLNVLIDSNNLQAKRSSNPITIDGVTPNVKTIKITSDADSGNQDSKYSYLKSGKIITATVTTDKVVSVQGSPKIHIYTGEEYLDLNWKSISSDGKTLTFNKTVSNDDPQGIYLYSTAALDGKDVVKDSYGNSLSGTATISGENLYIDTTAPEKPVINKEDGTVMKSGKYQTTVPFTITTDSDDSTIKKLQYSVDGGNTWKDYSSKVTLVSDSNLVARAVDYAGNISEYTDIYELEISNSFPDYYVECSNSDGYYKTGSVLTFKVNFEEEVNIASDSKAYITLSAYSGTITSGAQASLVSSYKGKSSVTSAEFTYTVQQTDEFILKIAKDSVILSGFTDLYGFTQNTKTLDADYERSGLKCDGVAPTVTAMVPQKTKTTQNSLNAYDNAKQIILTFSENVSAVSGNIYLRQTKGWAIPPMFTADEFNTVLSAVNNVTASKSTNNLTGSQVLYMDGLEDGENLYSSLVGAANDRYHGTAQYVGPYKKMTNGINDDGTPDLDVKYVLDFGVDIWDSAQSSKEYFGLTYTPNWTKDGTDNTYNTYHHAYRAGWVNVVTPTNHITTDTIRYVLEQAHLHERYMAVNSSYVTISGNTVTLNFPNGLLGDDDLPLGREWELVIEAGAFMDEAGNLFGYEYASDSATSLSKTIDLENTTESTTYYADSIQCANSGTTKTTSWGRKRTKLASTDNPVVLIQDGNNAAFMSAGVEKPVIRVDRYSYGLGIKQPTEVTYDSKNNKYTVTYEQIDSSGDGSTKNLQTGITAPTAKVAVKIDCESKAATVRYAMNSATNNLSSAGSTSTTGTIPSSATSGTKTGSGNIRVSFLAGSGSHTTSSKQYITADATVEYVSKGETTSKTDSSDLANEGVFQTVVNFYKPNYTGNPNSDGVTKNWKGTTTAAPLWLAGAGRQVVNIHGTTGAGGVPSITPYPLRDQPVSSAYMRQTYQDSENYYWVSYEILKDGIYSMYIVGSSTGGSDLYGTGNSLFWGDWAQSYSKMVVGEFNRCDSMLSYLAQPTYTTTYDRE